jgi:hypothetical protein
MSRTILKAIGVLVCLTGGFLMYNGSILGESTSGIATVLGIIGIGIITSSNKAALATKHGEGM